MVAPLFPKHHTTITHNNAAKRPQRQGRSRKMGHVIFNLLQGNNCSGALKLALDIILRSIGLIGVRQSLYVA
jgi:hypothetical protein